MLRSGRPRHWSRWLYRIQWLLLALIGLAVVAVRVGLLKLDASFTVFAGLGLAMVAVALISMLVFLWGLIRRHSEARTAALWAMVMGLIPVAVPLFTVGQQNLSAPSLYDITTDPQDPPQFDLLLSLRKEGDHSPDYPGNMAAEVQRATPAYRDIQPLILTASSSDVMSYAEGIARELGWRVIAVQPGKGQMEAVVRTPILGVTQDIVVRFRAEGEPVNEQPGQKGGGRPNDPGKPGSSEPATTRVDMRSASRVGSRDLGSNAHRIRTFMKRLEQRVSQGVSDGKSMAQ